MWKFRPVSELLSEPVRNGVYKPKQFHGSGYRVVNMGDLFGNDYISAQDMRRVNLTSNELRLAQLRDGDLLFARRSFVLAGAGKCALVVNPPEPTVFESSIIRARLDDKVANPRFYHYLFQAPLGRSLIGSIATRTAVSGITGSDLARLRVPWVERDMQDEIVATLSPYDDLMANNRKRIRVLDEIAEIVYAEWFVSGRYPQRIAESLEAPEDWEQVPFSGAATFVNGFSFGPTHWGTTGTPIVKIAELKDGITASTPRYSGASVGPRVDIVTGDVLFSWSADLDVYIWAYGLALLNQHLFKVLPRDGYSRTFLYSALKAHMAQFRARSQGTTMRHIKRAALTEVTFASPPQRLRDSFEELVGPLLALGTNLRTRNAVLAEQRAVVLQHLLTNAAAAENSQP